MSLPGESREGMQFSKRPNCLSQLPTLLMCSCLFSAKLSILCSYLPLASLSVFLPYFCSFPNITQCFSFTWQPWGPLSLMAELRWVPLQFERQNPGVAVSSTNAKLALRKRIVIESWHSLHSPVWNVQWDTFGILQSFMCSDHFPPFTAHLNFPKFMEALV